MSSNSFATARLNRRMALRTGAGALMGAALLGAQTGHGVRAQGTAGNDVEPRAGSWKPWWLKTGNQLRPPAPPDKAATDAEIAQLRTLVGQRDAPTRDRIVYWDAGAAPYRWSEILNDQILTKTPLPLGLGARALVLMHTAIADAMIATWEAKYTYNRPRPTTNDPTLTAIVPVPRSPSYPSEHAAAAGAAGAVLAYLFPKDADAFAALAEEAARSRLLAGVQYPSDVAAGLDLGRKIAALVLEYAKTDGSAVPWTGSVPEGPGLWTGTNPIGAAEAVWKTFILSSASQLRPDPPPAYDSDQRAAELAELKNFVRTPLTNAIALGWQYGFSGGATWLRWGSQRMFEERLDANAPWVARAYSMLSIALYDTWVASQDAKYTYWTARPVQFDPTFTTVFPTPNHPSYPSNRASINYAPLAVLKYLFPRDAAVFQSTADQISESALWAGIHFRSDIEAGNAMALGVVKLLTERSRADG